MGASDVRAGGAYVEIGARDHKLGVVLQSAQAKLRAFSANVHQMGVEFLKVGGVLAAPILLGVKAFAQFDDAMTKVATLLQGADTAYMASYREGVRKMAVEFGQAADSISSGLYDVLSANVPATQAMNVLREAMRMSVTTGVDVRATVEALTSVMNGFGISSAKAADTTDWFFAVQKAGAADVAALVPIISRLAPVAAQAGISLEELGAAVATVSSAGMRSEDAVTGLRMMLLALMTPTDEVREAMKQMGVELTDATLKTVGLRGVLAKLAASGATAEQLGRVFSARGLTAALALIRDQRGYMDALRATTVRAGAAQEAYQKRTESLQQSLNRLWQSVQQVFVSIGQALSGPGKNFLEWLGRGLEGLARFIENNPVLVQSLAALAGVLATAGAGLLALSAAMKMVAFATQGATVAVKALHVALGPVGIATAVAGLILHFGTWSKQLKDTGAEAEKLAQSQERQREQYRAQYQDLEQLLSIQERTVQQQKMANNIARALGETLGFTAVQFDEYGNAVALAGNATEQFGAKLRALEVAQLQQQVRAAMRQMQEYSAELQNIAQAGALKRWWKGWTRDYMNELIRGVDAARDRADRANAALMALARAEVIKGGVVKGKAVPAAPVEVEAPRVEVSEAGMTTQVVGTFAGTLAAQIRPAERILQQQLEQLKEINRKLDKPGAVAGAAQFD